MAPASMAPALGGPEVLGTRMMRQNTNQRKQAMSEIEASVTKLLIATKQLLESLTQWSRLEASENDVSDIYVNLGNEFNRATISFQNAGVDMSDLENTPNELRHILERALGEDASVTNLDKFLPRIREIIINLLQGLKRKQQIHRIQNGEAAAPPRLRRTESPNAIHHDLVRQRSASPSVASAASTPTPQTTSFTPGTNNNVAKRQLPSIPAHQTSPSQILPPRKAPEPPSVQRELFRPAPAIPSNSDPVTQLSQMTLERRSSKRFSENYLAQLTSSPNSDRSGKLSVNDVRKHLQKTVAIPETVEDEGAEDSIEYSASRAYGSPQTKLPVQSGDRSAPTSPSLPSPVYRVIDTPVPRSPDLRHNSKGPADHSKIVNGVTNGTTGKPGHDTLFIFLKKGDHTKKATFEGDMSMDKLRSTIEAIHGPVNDDLLYIEDVESRVSYELETIADVKQRSVILIRPRDAADAREGSKDTTTPHEDLRAWLDQRLERLKLEIADLKPNTPSDMESTRDLHPDAPNLSSTASAAKSTDHQLTESLSDFEKLKIENQELQTELAAAKAALEAATSTEPASIVVSANRDHVMSMSAKHEHRGTELTAKLEEAMNTMERIRKDVLQRKVTPRPQQLADLSKDFEEIEKESSALAENLVLLDAASNKLWEEELTIITSEQDALEYQRAFIEDIKTDLEQSLSSLSTIKQVEEQKRSGSVTSVPMVLETSTDPSRALKFVQADIKSLQINHERRAEAIADAEKQREKEREYLMENEFKKELGDFVGSNNLKKTGGAAEIERVRAEKDDALRKANFLKTTSAPPQNDALEPKESTDTNAKLEIPHRDESSQFETSPSDPVLAAEEPLAASEAPISEEKASSLPDIGKPRAVSGSASILARIDASTRGFDALERRRSSAVKHAPSSDSVMPKHKQEQNDATIEEHEVGETINIVVGQDGPIETEA